MKKHKPEGYQLLRDLHDLWLLVNESVISVIVLIQAAESLRDEPLKEVLAHIEKRNEQQRDWLLTRIKQAAPQTLTVPQ